MSVEEFYLNHNEPLVFEEGVFDVAPNSIEDELDRLIAEQLAKTSLGSDVIEELGFSLSSEQTDKTGQLPEEPEIFVWRAPIEDGVVYGREELVAANEEPELDFQMNIDDWKGELEFAMAKSRQATEVGEELPGQVEHGEVELVSLDQVLGANGITADIYEARLAANMSKWAENTDQSRPASVPLVKSKLSDWEQRQAYIDSLSWLERRKFSRQASGPGLASRILFHQSSGMLSRKISNKWRYRTRLRTTSSERRGVVKRVKSWREGRLKKSRQEALSEQLAAMHRKPVLTEKQIAKQKKDEQKKLDKELKDQRRMTSARNKQARRQNSRLRTALRVAGANNRERRRKIGNFFYNNGRARKVKG